MLIIQGTKPNYYELELFKFPTGRNLIVISIRKGEISTLLFHGYKSLLYFMVINCIFKILQITTKILNIYIK